MTNSVPDRLERTGVIPLRQDTIKALEKADMAKEATKIYRLALPKNANFEQRHNFEKQILAIRQVNPGWVVMNDWAKPGEKEAVVIIRKNQNYPYSRALYLAKSHLGRVIAGGYGDKL